MKQLALVCGTILIGALICGSSIHADVKSSSKEEIETLEKGLIDAGNRSKVDEIMSYYDPSDKLLVFDIVPPREYRGAAAWRKHLQDLAPDFTGVTELIDLEVHADGHLAFASSIQHFVGKTKDGKPIDITTRVTDCLQKQDGKWTIVHQHISAPIDLATGKADFQSK